MSTDTLSEPIADPDLVWLDPRALAAHPANVRFDLRDLDELADSIAESGVIEPLVVVPLNDGHRIVAGHRRAAAAIMADLDSVPCWVRPHLADLEPDQLAAALAENLQRDSLTPLEEAHAYAQLSAFPTWSAERIATVTGRQPSQVRHLIEVTKLADAVQPAAAHGDLSLAEAAELEEFANDPATYQRLLERAGGHAFRHILAQTRRDREIAQRDAEVRGDLEAAGVPIIKKLMSRGGVECELRYLAAGDDGTDLDPEEHAACPGHAAFLDSFSGEAVYVCQEPKAHGHQTPNWYQHLTEEEAATWAAEEEAARAREAALQVAADARRAFVRQRIAAKGKPPAGTLRLAVEAILGDDGLHLDSPDDVAWYLGHDEPESIDVDEALAAAVRKAADGRLPLLLLAVAAVGAEENLTRYKSRWGHSPAFVVRWLTFLTGIGYELSEAESELLEQARAAVADEDQEDDPEAA